MKNYAKYYWKQHCLTVIENFLHSFRSYNLKLVYFQMINKKQLLPGLLYKPLFLVFF